MGSRSSTLPLMGGPFNCGIADLMQGTNDPLPDATLEMPFDHPESIPPLFVRVFYPTDAVVGKGMKWLDRDEYLDGMAEHLQQWKTGMKLTFKSLAGRMRVPAIWHAPISTKQTKYPVMIFSHGLSSARWIHNVTCASMTKQGFIVIVVEHSDLSTCWTYRKQRLPDNTWIEIPFEYTRIGTEVANFHTRNKQAEYRATEILEVFKLAQCLNKGEVDQATLAIGDDFNWKENLASYMDFTNVTLYGHSFGCSTTLSAVAQSPNTFKRAICIDSWMMPVHRDNYEKIRFSGVPVLFINAGLWQWKENVAAMMRIIDNDERKMLTILKAQHTTFCDISHIVPKWFDRGNKIKGEISTILCDQMTTAAMIDFVENGSISDATFEEYKEHWIFGSQLKYQDAKLPQLDKKTSEQKLNGKL